MESINVNRYSTVQYSTVQYSTAQHSRGIEGYQKSRGSKPLQVITHPPLSTGDSTFLMMPPIQWHVFKWDRDNVKERVG